MTHFETLYAKLLSDPNYGKIGSRKDQFRKMYLEGMIRMFEVANDVYNKTNAPGEILISLHEEIKAIAEESK